jgi:hypothetical protein
MNVAAGLNKVNSVVFIFQLSIRLNKNNKQDRTGENHPRKGNQAQRIQQTETARRAINTALSDPLNATLMEHLLAAPMWLLLSAL